MKLILVMVMLATALSTSGCASRRAAAREAQAAKLAKTAPPVAATRSATPAAAPAADTAVNTYAVSPMPATAKNTAVVAQTSVMVAPARPASVASTSRPVAPMVAVVSNVSAPSGAVQRSESGSKAVETSFTPPLENIEKVPFQIGTSSVTVERLAQAAGCAGGKGAGLVTEKGPVEVYRMQCDNGKIFLAKCELRQCSPMRW